MTALASCVTLIENQEKRLQTFVADQWRYVSTPLNPADDASRGVSEDSLYLWIHGIEFLIQPTNEWPQPPAVMVADIPDDDLEVKAETTKY